MAAVTEANSALSYDSALTMAVNNLSEIVLGKKLFANFRGPKKYTGNCKNIPFIFFNSRLQKIFKSQDRLLEFTSGRECERPKCFIYIQNHIFKKFE